MPPAIHLHTFDSDMAVAWGHAFESDDGIKIIEGDILVGTADAVVSPANSFGYMDGGIDLAYRKFFQTFPGAPTMLLRYRELRITTPCKFGFSFRSKRNAR